MEKKARGRRSAGNPRSLQGLPGPNGFGASAEMGLASAIVRCWDDEAFDRQTVLYGVRGTVVCVCT
jgi:hypothetical protein